MTKQDADEILQYIAKNILSPMAFDSAQRVKYGKNLSVLLSANYAKLLMRK